MISRRYHPGDRAPCLALFDSNVPEHFRPEERAEFARYLDDLPGPYLVLVDDDGRICACGGFAMEADGETASICWDIVDRSLQGRGLGRRLLEERLALAEATPGVRRIRLSTSQRTRDFYGRFGFTAVNVEPEGIGPGLDRVEMEKRLGR